MKTACVLAALVGSASAFAPAGRAATSSALQMSSIPEGYDDLVGIDVETGNKFVSSHFSRSVLIRPFDCTLRCLMSWSW